MGSCNSHKWHGQDMCDNKGKFMLSFVPDQYRGTADACGHWHGLEEAIKVCGACFKYIEDWVTSKEGESEARWVNLIDKDVYIHKTKKKA